MTSLARRTLLGLCAIAALCAQAVQTAAQSWPTRPVRFIVPVAAGTATDITARLFGEKLAPLWGQPVVVENRPGADGLIALGSFVSAQDDHTLLFSFSTAVSLNPLIHARLPYDPEKDLVPITTTTEVQFGIAVHSAVPAASMKQLGDHIKANPGKLNWVAAPGLPRFVLERHRREHSLDMVYVNYTQTGTAVQDLGEGRVQVMIASVASLVPVLESGKARLLAIASADRTALAPQTQSAPESGFPDLAVPAVGCVYGWRDMPTALRDRLAKDIDAVAQDGQLVERFARAGQIMRRSSPAALAALLTEQRVQLAPLAAAMAPPK